MLLEYDPAFHGEESGVSDPFIRSVGGDLFGVAEEVERALTRDKTCARVIAMGLRPCDGDLVGVRLNLNVLKSQKVALQTIHRGSQSGGHARGRGFFNGPAIWYEQTVTLRDAYFNVSQSGRERIASGATSKFPIASVDGKYVRDAYPDFDGVVIRFDPKKVHLFTTEDYRPVRWAEEVTVQGHRVYARGRIEFFTQEDSPRPSGPSPSAVIFLERVISDDE